MKNDNPITAQTRCTAFAGQKKVAAGELAAVAERIGRLVAQAETAPILLVNDGNGEIIDLDLRGGAEAALNRLTPAPRGPGRPKLGVVAREVTLLPRHWEWLNAQPGGASVALRKLVDAARRDNAGLERVRCAQEACFRFMSGLGGDLPDFEEALRALFAKDGAGFEARLAAWPEDLRDYARMLAAPVFETQPSGNGA
jgi:hypothetical protein